MHADSQGGLTSTVPTSSLHKLFTCTCPVQDYPHDNSSFSSFKTLRYLSFSFSPVEKLLLVCAGAAPQSQYTCDPTFSFIKCYQYHSFLPMLIYYFCVLTQSHNPISPVDFIILRLRCAKGTNKNVKLG